MHYFPETTLLKKQAYTMQNDFLEGIMEETKCCSFNVFEMEMCSQQDCSIRSFDDEYAYMSFSAALSGHFSTITKQENQIRHWKTGTGNIVVANHDMNGQNQLYKNEAIKMFNLLISKDFFKQLAIRYPEMFENSYKRYEHGESFYLSPQNIYLSPFIQTVMDDIRLCNIQGVNSRMYLEAKITECLAMFLQNLGVKESREEKVTVNEIIKEKIYEAKDILLNEYMNPPSLHDLAIRVGTNECTLKKAFREVFNTTVFGYLLNYRLNLAAHYLRDTKKTIQEIATTVGYEHHSHFCTAFKKKYGISPSNYIININGKKAV